MKNAPSLILVLLLTASTSVAQLSEKSPSVSLINPQLPFIYITFDHVGQGAPEFDSEPAERVWLRLVNNSSVPISVGTQSIPKGRPNGEIGVADRIVRSEEVLVCATLVSGEHDPPGCSDTPPVGYLQIPEYPLADVSIAPGTNVLFSVPISHIALSGFWFIEIPFRFKSIPSNTRSSVKSNLGGEVSTSVQYGEYDIPKNHYDEFRKAWFQARE